MLKILHIVQDDAKFFVPNANCFDTDGRYINNYYCILSKGKTDLSSLKTDGRVTPLRSGSEIKNALVFPDYDVIFFHSLPVEIYKYFRYIPNDKIVIWWGWGYDLYLRKRGMRPLIPIRLYKEETAKYIRTRDWSLPFFVKWIVKELFIKHYYYLLRNRVLRRIDYFMPVISVEYDLMKKYNRHFKAKEFYYESYNDDGKKVLTERQKFGDIIIGNSASCTCNHLDIIKQLKNVKLEKEQKFIVPLNYVDLNYGAYVNKVSGRDDFVALTTFISRDEWFSIVNDCSYYILGALRQQAMGNVFYCLNNGLKLFLYKDGLIFKWLKGLGCAVFTIEDIDANSFSTPLSLSDAEKNRAIYTAELKRQAKVSHMDTENIEKQLCGNYR